MARDTKRNAYFYVGIPRTSQTYQCLLTEAQETGISIPQLLALRVSDWYKGTRSPATGEPTTEKSETQANVTEDEYQEVAASNANAALDEWL